MNKFYLRGVGAGVRTHSLVTHKQRVLGECALLVVYRDPTPLTCLLIILLMMVSSSAKEVPTLFLTVGGGWPGMMGYSGGSSPVSSPSLRHSSRSSSVLSASFSCKPLRRSFRASNISWRAASRLSLLPLSEGTRAVGFDYNKEREIWRSYQGYCVRYRARQIELKWLANGRILGCSNMLTNVNGSTHPRKHLPYCKIQRVENIFVAR